MTHFETDGASTPDGAPDVEVSIDVKGDEKAAETMHMHLANTLSQGFEAITEEKPPAESSSTLVAIDWRQRFQIIRDNGERR